MTRRIPTRPDGAPTNVIQSGDRNLGAGRPPLAGTARRGMLDAVTAAGRGTSAAVQANRSGCASPRRPPINQVESASGRCAQTRMTGCSSTSFGAVRRAAVREQHALRLASAGRRRVLAVDRPPLAPGARRRSPSCRIFLGRRRLPGSSMTGSAATFTWSWHCEGGAPEPGRRIVGGGTEGLGTYSTSVITARLQPTSRNLAHAGMKPAGCYSTWTTTPRRARAATWRSNGVVQLRRRTVTLTGCGAGRARAAAGGAAVGATGGTRPGVRLRSGDLQRSPAAAGGANPSRPYR